MFQINIKPDAEEDVDVVFKWYEKEREGLGFEFLDLLDEAIKKLKYNPQYYFNVSPVVRRIPTRRFPYNIYYTIENENVHIHAIMHQYRNPKEWKKRLKK